MIIKILKIFACLYNASIWAMLFTVLMFLNTWLEMRVNMGLIFFAVLAAILTLSLRRSCCTLRVSTISLTAVIVICRIILGSDGFAVIPAAIIREGLMLPRLPLSIINFMIDMFLALGWIAIAIREALKIHEL